jgi:hypothetical protein
MGDAFKPIQTGERLRIHAAAYNAMLEAAKTHANRLNDRAGDVPMGFDRNIVPIYNGSGVDVLQFGVLAMAGPITLPEDNASEFRRRPTFAGVTPTVDATADDRGRFVVLLEPARAGAIVRGIADGVTIAKVDITDEIHSRADVAHETTANLVSGFNGAAEILWAEPGTGVKLATVRIGVFTRSYYLIELTGFTSIGANRWSYQWEEVVLNISGTYSTKPGGMTSATHGVAYCRWDANNSASGIQCNGVNVNDLNTGIALKPFGPAVVEMRFEQDCNGNWIPMFGGPIQPGGQCI